MGQIEHLNAERIVRTCRLVDELSADLLRAQQRAQLARVTAPEACAVRRALDLLEGTLTELRRAVAGLEDLSFRPGSGSAGGVERWHRDLEEELESLTRHWRGDEE